MSGINPNFNQFHYEDYQFILNEPDLFSSADTKNMEFYTTHLRLVDSDLLNHEVQANFEKLIEIARDPQCDLKLSTKNLRNLKDFNKNNGLKYLEQFLGAMINFKRLTPSQKNKHLFKAALEINDLEYIKKLISDNLEDFRQIFYKKVSRECSNPHPPSEKSKKFAKKLAEHGQLNFNPKSFPINLYKTLLNLEVEVSKNNLFSQNPLCVLEIDEFDLISKIYDQDPEGMKPEIKMFIINYIKTRPMHPTLSQNIAEYAPLIPYYNSNLNFPEFKEELVNICMRLFEAKAVNTIFFITSNFKLDSDMVSKSGITPYELLINYSAHWKHIQFLDKNYQFFPNPNIRFSSGELFVNKFLTHNNHPQDFEKIQSILNQLVKACKLDLNVKDINGIGPLQIAMDMDRPQLVLKLLELGAKDFKAQNRQGDSLLSWAIEKHPDFIEKFIKFVPLDILNARNETFLHSALKTHNLELARFALKHCKTKNESLINAETFEGNTPLFYAMQYCSPQIVSELLEAGANLCVLNKAGQCPLDKLDENQRLVHHRFITIMKYFPDFLKRFPALRSDKNTKGYLARLIATSLSDENFTSRHKTELIALCLALNYDFDSLFRNEVPVNISYLAEMIKALKMSHSYVLNSFLDTNMDHVNQEVAPAEIPPAPENVNIRDLLKMFKEIRVTDEKGPGHLTAAELALGHLDDHPEKEKRRPLTKEALYAKLENYITHVLVLLPKVDIPKSTDPLEDLELRKKYYGPIKNVLQHLVLICQKLSIEERVLLLRDLALGAGYCSTRWYGLPLELFKEFMLKLGGQPVDRNFGKQLFTELASARAGILQTQSGSNVHHFAQYAKFLADKIKIPYRNSLINFKEQYHMKDVDSEQLMKAFLRYYNPPFIVELTKEFIKFKMREELVVADASSVNAWFGQNIPADYKADLYKKHEVELRRLKEMLDKKIENNEITKERADLAIMALFNKRDIPIGRPSTRVEDAIANSRYEDYITNVVFKDYTTPRLEGILHMLTTLGIVHERFPGFLVKLEAELEKTIEEIELEEQDFKRAKKK